jgi:mannose-1-phosphate guanylyltransferase
MIGNQIKHVQPEHSSTTKTKPRWGIILAGGDGVRLRSLTRAVSGDDRPKQFSPLLGGQTLLTRTRLRVAKSIDPLKTIFVVTEAHERFFSDELAAVSPRQIVVQPANRGTLPAILWGLLRIARFDRTALVALFPSDHYYADEDKFMTGVVSAFNCAEKDTAPVILLGAAAKHAETEYGWIEPDSTVLGDFDGRLMHVKHFWEKPSHEIAKRLLNQGCFWNTFVMVGSVRAFLEMIRRACAGLYGAFEPLSSLPRLELVYEFMRHVYNQLPAADFSKEVLSVSTEALRVASLGDSGWSDLGDPRRLITTLHESGIENPWVDSGTCSRCGVTLGATTSS